MGFSQAIAAAIVFGGIALAAYTTTDRLAQARSDADESWRQSYERSNDAARAAVTITSVTRTGVWVYVRADNTGAVALQGDQVTLLLNGLPVTLFTRLVDGRTTDVWAPGETIELRVNHAMPTSAVVVTEYGALAVWRS